MSELYSFVVFLFAVIFIYFSFIRKTRLDTILATINGPVILPLIGNFLDVAGPPEDFLDKIRGLSQRYGPRFRLRILRHYYVLLTNPEDVEKVLNSNVNLVKSADYDVGLKPWLGTGLITSTGEKWHSRRKLLTPAFHFKVLEQFIPTFNDHAFKLVQTLKEEYTNGKVDILHPITRSALNIICETAMGKNIDSLSLENSEYTSSVLKINKLIQLRILTPWYRPEYLWNLTSHSAEQKKVLKILHGFTEKVIRERKQQNIESMRQKVTGAIDDDGLQVKKKLAFLDLVLEVQEKNPQLLTDDDIREETDTFMFAGHDTISTSLSFTLFLLGCYPEIQAKVHRELDEIFENDRYRPVETQDLVKMKYIECVIKESLRLFPSASLIQRFIQQDIILNDGQIIPKGVTMLVPIFIIHRNEEIFPEANEFKPERFQSENMEKRRSPFAYIPFSAGPRNCIGQKYAMIEQKVLLANILRHFIIKAEEKLNDLKLSTEIVLRSHYGINVSLKCR